MKILLVSHFFPPVSVIASHRPYGWARAWSALGHEVHVLTPRKSPIDGPLDLHLATEGLHMHTVSFGWKRARPPAELADQKKRIECWNTLKQKTRFIRNKLGILADIRIFFVPSIVRAGLKLAWRERFDVMVSTYGPPSNIIAASLLERKTKIPWLIDYQDLWSENYLHVRSAWSRRFRLFAERLVVRRAAMLVTLSQGLAKRLKQGLGRDAMVAHFGYLEDDDDPPADCRIEDTTPTLVYAGRVYETRQTAGLFFLGLRNALLRKPELRRHLRVEFYGPDQALLAPLLKANGISTPVRLHGLIPHRQVLARERAAAGLLFFDWLDPAAEGVLTGKLFEYIRNKRPIVFIGAGRATEASDIARRSGCGIILQSDDEIERFLMDWPAGLSAAAPDEAVRSELSCRRQAELVLSAIERQVLGLAPATEAGYASGDVRLGKTR